MKRKMMSAFIAVILMIMGCGSALAGKEFEPNDQQLKELFQVKSSIKTVSDLEKRGVLSKDVAEAQRQYYLTSAQISIGKPMEAQSLAKILEKAENNTTNKKIGTWQKMKNHFTFANIMLFIFACVLLAGAVMLFIRYVMPVMVALLYGIPAEFYEFLVYAACGAGIFGGMMFAENISSFIALLGCLGLIGGFVLTHHLHEEALKNFYEKFKPIKALPVVSLMLFVVWAAVAIMYNSSMIGFLSVMALESFLGFSVMVMPFCVCIGYDSEDAIPRAVGASSIILAAYIAYRIVGVEVPILGIFSTGALWMGSFAYYVGLIFLASEGYGKRNSSNYIFLQVVTIVSGIAALYLGTVWEINELRGIGGVFFFLYGVVKYFEIINFTKHIAWGTFGLGLLGFVFFAIAKQYPQFFFMLI